MSSQPLLDESLPAGGHTAVALRREQRGRCMAAATWVLLPWAIGAALAALFPSRGTLPPRVEAVSHVVGWVYFAAWSVSFYPQLWLNFRRKSVVGLSLDFQLLNLLGFASYAIYNCALYYNDAVRRQYQSLHHGQLPAVHANDVFFALHAAAATAITLLQCVLYDRGGHRPARASVAAVAAAVAAAAAWAAAVVLIPPVKPDACPNASCPPESLLTWLSWLYFLGYIKLGVSLVKYMPQLVLNHRRRSTEGWNVWNVLLDFEGGALSLAQQALDSAACEDWSFFFGNPVKFGLSVVSLLFDVAFVAQHYCFYPSNRRAAALEAMERDLEKASCESGEEGEDGAEAPPSAERDPDAERRPLLA